MFGLGTTELLIILVMVFVVFGAGKLPEMARSLGSGIRNFQKSVRGEEESDTPPEKLAEDQQRAMPDEHQSASAKKHTLPADLSQKG